MNNTHHDQTEAVINIQGITKTYHLGEIDLQVLKGIDLKIERGEFVSIMGPSGSGKSTLMNILGALDQPTDGTYYLDGIDVAKLPEKELARIRNKKIGFVFQNFNLLKRTTALRQVELPLMYGGAGGRTQKARAALESVGLIRTVGSPTQRIIGRPAAAGRHCTGAGDRTVADPGGRTHWQPGYTQWSGSDADFPNAQP